MLLAEPEKSRGAINEIKKDIAYKPIDIKKTWVKKYYLMNESQMKFIMIMNFKKLVDSHSHQLTERV